MKCHRCFAWVLAIAILGAWSVTAHAAGPFSFSDAEKPNPEFQRSGANITAKFIPRAKSSSVVITFGVSAGGSLESVKGIDFETVARPEVDVKNFKSAVFEIRVIDVKPGETVEIFLQSDFFTQSTAFYVYSPNRAKPWQDVKAGNRSLAERVRELIVVVRDGGELDADGLTDGRITVIGGPRDSFWGYALGTLFIRFFGIFIVLSILMIGMLLSGLVFTALQRSKTRRDEDQKNAVAPVAAEHSAEASFDDDAVSVGVPEDVAAAIGVAVHLHLAGMRRLSGPSEAAGPEKNWASDGRRRMMHDRLSIFNRHIR
jgi:hypothetical protein